MNFNIYFTWNSPKKSINVILSFLKIKITYFLTILRDVQITYSNSCNDIKDPEVIRKLQCSESFSEKMFWKSTIYTVLALAFSTSAWVNVVENWDDPGPRRTEHGPTIQISQGLIRGEVEFYDGLSSHISYKGIPYAQGQLTSISYLH